MSENYYYNINICECCERQDTLHVGKSSTGWSFHFQAYRDWGADRLTIESASDWAKIFKTVPGILTDEAGVVIDDPLAWLSKLEPPTPSQQADEDSPERRGVWADLFDPNFEWRDSDGFAFDLHEFS